VRIKIDPYSTRDRSEERRHTIEYYHTDDNDDGYDRPHEAYPLLVFFLEKEFHMVLCVRMLSGFILWYYEHIRKVLSINMREFEKKRRIKGVLYSWPAIIVLIGIFFFLANAAWNAYQKAHIAFVGKEKVLNQLNELQERERELTSKINHLQSAYGVEAEMRERFGVVKTGEEVVEIIDPTSGAQDTNPTPLKKGFWATIIGFFTGE